MNDVAPNSQSILNIDQAAAMVGISVDALRIYIASGDLLPVDPLDSELKFDRAEVEKVAGMHQNALNEIRHKAIEQMTAENAVIRRAIDELVRKQVSLLSDQQNQASSMENQLATISALHDTAKEIQNRLLSMGELQLGQSERIGALHNQIESVDRSLDSLDTKVQQVNAAGDVIKSQFESSKRQADLDRQNLKMQSQSIELLQSVVDSQRKTIEEQSQLVTGALHELTELRSRLDKLMIQQAATPQPSQDENPPAGVDPQVFSQIQEDLYNRINKLQDSLDAAAQARGQVNQIETLYERTKADQKKEIDALKEENRGTRQLILDLTQMVEAQRKQVEHLKATQVTTPVEPTSPKVEAEPTTKPETKRTKEQEPTGPAPAPYNTVREIEFNFLLERMGYQRLDRYSQEDLLDSTKVEVPNDDLIRAFLATNELYCEVEEVEIRMITRAGWNMIKYQRVERKATKKGWVGAN